MFLLMRIIALLISLYFTLNIALRAQSIDPVDLEKSANEFFKSLKYRSAQEAYSVLDSIKPGNPVVTYRLGVSYLHNGFKKKALDCFIKVSKNHENCPIEYLYYLARKLIAIPSKTELSATKPIVINHCKGVLSIVSCSTVLNVGISIRTLKINKHKLIGWVDNRFSILPHFSSIFGGWGLRNAPGGPGALLSYNGLGLISLRQSLRLLQHHHRGSDRRQFQRQLSS